MELIVFLKPIFDMLWKFKILDIMIMSLVYLVTPMYLLKNKYKIEFIDLLFIFLITLFTLSFLKKADSASFKDYIKIISNLYMFFIGKMILNRDEKDKFLIISFSVVAFVNLIYLLTGIGFTYWGDSKTFRGIYFFKTDLALAILQSIIFIRLMKYSKSEKLKTISNIYIFLISPILIFLSNSRMYLLLYFIVIYLILNENAEKKGRKTYRYDLKFFLKIGIIFICLIFLYSTITSKIPWFREQNLLGFKIEKFSDLFNESNSQGRNVIWSKVIHVFNSSSIIDKFTGVDLVSDRVLHNGSYYDSHNNYIKILFTTGYLGGITCLIILVDTMKKLNSLTDLKFKYTCLILLTVYVVSSISYPSIIYTQQSWIIFLYIGMLNNNVQRSKNDE
ncbi:O-antigen ligase family protein [Paraclostridium bifermentans]|uniref:O-antigen ligase family protein n=1 Tax=Paraclostridium bifermentans TaxID=1490 RepID=UPI001C81D22B|nr:O-antigen ligase family protein [Paraclostridium bifermentans]GIM33803.1 hypothetical protein PAGU1678_30720 [Paraclostridium bifermentans subsp. muricolitidis]